MRRRYELTRIPSLDSVPDNGDLVVENGPLREPELLPIHMLRVGILAEVEGQIGAEIMDLENRIHELENGGGESNLSAPMILHNQTVIEIAAGQTIGINLVASGSPPPSWVVTGLHGSMFEVVPDVGNSVTVRSTTPLAAGTYLGTVIAQSSEGTSQLVFSVIAGEGGTVQLPPQNLSAPQLSGDPRVGDGIVYTAGVWS